MKVRTLWYTGLIFKILIMKSITTIFTIFALAFAMSGCTDSDQNGVEDAAYEDGSAGIAVEETTDVLGPQNVASDWVVLDAGDFILYAPSDWTLEEGTGYDSSVGSFSNGEIALEYDYGMYASEFKNNSNYDENAYEVNEVNLNGFDSVIYTSSEEDGYTVLNVIDPKGEGLSLNLYVQGLNSEQEELVVQIFETIFFKQ